MPLVKLPFEQDNDEHVGDIWVDPTDIVIVSRSFDRVHVVLKCGARVASAVPKLATAPISGTPDSELLDRWVIATVRIANGVTRTEALDS